MPTPAEPDLLPRLRATVLTITERVHELDRLCRDAASLLDRLSPPPEPDPEVALSEADETLEPRQLGTSSNETGAISPEAVRAGLEERQGALLVAVTIRGGTVASPMLSLLAAELGLGAGALEELFAGVDPHLVRRAGGRAGLTERGMESAAEWRGALSEELLRLTDL